MLTTKTNEYFVRGQQIYDMPDIIEVREKVITKSERVENIACDLNDTSWFDRIDAKGGVVFMAAGVFYYFLRDQIQTLFTAMQKRFRGGRLVFDTAGKRAVKMMVKTWIKEAGITSISDDELTQRFKESIRIDDEIRRIKGLPVARYDDEKNI